MYHFGGAASLVEHSTALGVDYVGSRNDGPLVRRWGSCWVCIAVMSSATKVREHKFPNARLKRQRLKWSSWPVEPVKVNQKSRQLSTPYPTERRMFKAVEYSSGLLVSKHSKQSLQSLNLFNHSKITLQISVKLASYDFTAFRPCIIVPQRVPDWCRKLPHFEGFHITCAPCLNLVKAERSRCR
jgi:hypothetical protein